jgi:hypothetical protein
LLPGDYACLLDLQVGEVLPDVLPLEQTEYRRPVPRLTVMRSAALKMAACQVLETHPAAVSPQVWRLGWVGVEANLVLAKVAMYLQAHGIH